MSDSRSIDWHQVARRLSPAADRTRAEWAADIVLFGIAVAVVALSPLQYPHFPSRWWIWDLALGALAALSIWWTRRHPLLIGILVIIPGSIAISASAGTLTGVYRMGLLAPIVPGLIVTVLHIGTALPYHAIIPLPDLPWRVWVIMLPLLYAFPFSVGLLGRARRQVIAGLRDAAARDRQQYEQHLQTARQEERQQIAREMHDVLAHRISLMSVHAGALEYRVASNTPPSMEDLRQATRVIRESAYGAVDDLRDLLGLLRSDAAVSSTAPQPRLVDLDTLLAQAGAAGQRVDFTSDARPESIRETTQRTAYRVVQEALTNARKYAPCATVTLRLEHRGDRLGIRVCNPVPPGVTAADPVLTTGNGLVGLDERVTLDGGTFHAGVVDGEFRLEAILITEESGR